MFVFGTAEYISFVASQLDTKLDFDTYLTTHTIEQKDIKLTPTLKYIFDTIKKHEDLFSNVYLSHSKPEAGKALTLNITLDIDRIADENNKIDVVNKIMKLVLERLGLKLEPIIIYELLLKVDINDDDTEYGYEYYRIDDVHLLQFALAGKTLVLSINTKNVNNEKVEIFAQLVNKINLDYSRYLAEKTHAVITMTFKLTNDCYMTVISDEHINVINFYKEIYPKLKEFTI